MKVNELIPLICYRRVRIPEMTDAKWERILALPNENQILSVAFRHDLGTNTTRYAMGGVVIAPYRDFCGGLMVESGFADLDMHPNHGYTGYRILGGRETEDTQALPHINDLVANPPTTYAGLQKLLHKSIAAAVAMQAITSGRCMVHFFDKVGGRLSEIMLQLKENPSLELVPNGNLTCGAGRLQPFSLPGIDERGNLRTFLTLNEPQTRIKEVDVEWTETAPYRNRNSGNDVFGAVLNIEQGGEDPNGLSAHCDYCDETFAYDGYTECPQCSEEIFDEAATGREHVLRPSGPVEAMRESYSKQGAWKYVPYAMWRCG